MTTNSAVSYDVDGTMIGHLAVPDGAGRFPAVLVAHEGPGLDTHATSRSRSTTTVVANGSRTWLR
jgi:dienelactone hydrolase